MEKETLKNSMYNISLEIDGDSFIYNTLTDNFVINNSTSNDLMKGCDADTIHQLEQGGFCVDAEVNEQNLLLYHYQTARFNSSVINVFLIPSMMCNLDCEYCFTKDKNANCMDKETADHVVRFIYTLSKNTNQINITWGGGGEPLIATDIIVYIEQKLRQRIKIPIFSTIITNGTLLDETVAYKLQSAGISRIVVTIDGPADIHNKRRKLKSGADSFSLIKENIMKNSTLFECVVRMVVDKENDSYIENLIVSLQDIKNIKITLLHQMDCGGNCSENSYNKETYQRMLESSNEHNECYWGGEKPYLSLCNALRNFDFTINTDGGVYKCPVELNDVSCCVGNVREGIKVNRSYLRWLTHIPDCANENCVQCQYYPICSSLCLKVRDKYLNEFGCDQLKAMYNAIIKNKIQKWMRRR